MSTYFSVLVNRSEDQAYIQQQQNANYIALVTTPKNIAKTRLFKYIALRKHAYSNILRFLPPKNENFQMKHSDIFLISAQNIDCRYSLEPLRWGGSNEYPQSMFLSRNKKK